MDVVVVGAQEIAMSTMLIILLSWFLPALLLAPVLAWVIAKASPSQTAVVAEVTSRPPGKAAR